MSIAAVLGSAAARAQIPSVFHRFKVGTAEVTVVSDGSMTLPLTYVLPATDNAEIAGLYPGSDPPPATEIVNPVNITLVRIGGELILIDTGGGAEFMPTLGRLADNLALAGINPEMVTTVLFTHAHPDHLWGVIDPLDGGTLFPGARHLISSKERNFWTNPDTEAALPDAARSLGRGSRRRLGMIADRLDSFEPGTEVVPGVMLVDTAGHTPGHVSVMVRSGANEVMIGGDALIHPVFSFERPQWRWGPDVDHDTAAATRIRLLDRLATDKTELLGYHLPWPGLGHVERKAGGYHWVPTRRS